MKYEVSYLRKKKKGFSKQVVVFYTIEDAVWYENVIQQQGAKSIIICPK